MRSGKNVRSENPVWSIVDESHLDRVALMLLLSRSRLFIKKPHRDNHLNGVFLVFKIVPGAGVEPARP